MTSFKIVSQSKFPRKLGSIASVEVQSEKKTPANSEKRVLNEYLQLTWQLQRNKWFLQEESET